MFLSHAALFHHFFSLVPYRSLASHLCHQKQFYVCTLVVYLWSIRQRQTASGEHLDTFPLKDNYPDNLSCSMCHMAHKLSMHAHNLAK